MKDKTATEEIKIDPLLERDINACKSAMDSDEVFTEQTVEKHLEISIQENLITVENPITAFLSRRQEGNGALAYCIQGTDLPTQFEYVEFLERLLHITGVNEGKAKLFTTVADVFRTHEFLRQDYVDYRRGSGCFEVKEFCARIGDYTYKDEVQQFLTLVPNISHDTFLKIYIISTAFPKLVTYNIEGDEFEYCLFLYHIICGRDLLVINPNIKIEASEWFMMRFINHPYAYYNLETIEKIKEIITQQLIKVRPSMTETSTYKAMEEAKTLYGSGLDYVNQQIQVNFVKGTFEDIQAYWNLPLPLREGFENDGMVVSIPLIFTILKGIRSDRQFTKEMNQLFSTTEIIFEGDQVEVLKNPKILDAIINYLDDPTGEGFEMIFREMPYSLTDDVMAIYKKTIDFILELDILGTKQGRGYHLKKVVPLFTTLLHLEEKYSVALQNLSSFTGKPYQIIYQGTKNNTMKYEMACKLVVLGFLGCFDVVIWSPYKLRTIEGYVNESYIHTINLPNLDIHYKYKYRKSLLNTLLSYKEFL